MPSTWIWMWLMYQQNRLIIAKHPRFSITNVDTAKSILNSLKLRLGLILYHDHSECEEALKMIFPCHTATGLLHKLRRRVLF